MIESKELESIASDISQLKYASEEISLLLKSQSENIDQIETNINITEYSIDKSIKEIEKANEMFKSAKYKKGGITTIGGAVTGGAIGSIFGLPGIVIGTGSGAVIGATCYMIGSFID